MVESFKTEPYLRLNGKLTLPPIDEELKRSLGHENAFVVIDHMTFSHEL